MNYLHRPYMRFPRTESEAFKDHTYAVAVEHYRSHSYGSVWWGCMVAIALSAFVVIVWTR